MSGLSSYLEMIWQKKSYLIFFLEITITIILTVYSMLHCFVTINLHFFIPSLLNSSVVEILNKEGLLHFLPVHSKVNLNWLFTFIIQYFLSKILFFLKTFFLHWIYLFIYNPKMRLEHIFLFIERKDIKSILYAFTIVALVNQP